MQRPAMRLLCLTLGLMAGAAGLSCQQATSRGLIAVHPDTDAVFTSTRAVTSMAFAADGTLWVGTRGGVRRRGPDGEWRKYDRRDGLPSHEVRGIRVEEDGVTAILPQATAVWQENGWRVEPAASPHPLVQEVEGLTARAVWQGTDCVAALDGLRLRTGVGWRAVGLPPSAGTHISALLPRGDELWVAMYGEGIWSFDGDSWERVELNLPREARAITALTANGSTLWLGTNREGVWEYDAGEWRQHLQPEEPMDHNTQALAAYRGAVFASTLENGVAARTSSGWKSYRAPEMSTSVPRQMVEFHGRLYVRQGGGKVDCFDGNAWTRNVFPKLPRKEVSALASDGKRLYLAQWGGWSEWDGRRWTHFLKLPELQGVPITALLPDGDVMWVGTQRRGLAEVNRRSLQVRWHDERVGMPDDWITCLKRVADQLHAGTFVGGLATWDGHRWRTLPDLAGQNVTALEPDGVGGLFVATRFGLWHRDAEARLRRLNEDVAFLDTETQALLRVPTGLWIGTRTGLFFLTSNTLDVSGSG